MSTEIKNSMVVKRRINTKMIKRDSLSGTIVVYILLIMITLTMLLPFIHELAKSFSYPTEVEAGRVLLVPKKATVGNYFYFWRKQRGQLGRAFLNTIILTIVSMIWTVLNTALLAFPLSRPKVEFRLGVPILMLVIFCFVFQRPVIPYFLTVKAYGLMDKLAALILTHSVVPYYLVLVLTFFRGLPEELFDACRIDGGNEFHVFRHIAIPLSKAALATVAIFSGVTMWNIFFHAKLFIRSIDLMPLQPIVRSIMRGGGDILQGSMLDPDPFKETESIKSALIILTIVPVGIAYGFFQKYFTKGTMVGAIKS